MNKATPARQRGIALATALIFLVVITVLGLVAVRSSTTELRLAHNEQTRVEALQTAQAVVDAVLAGTGNLPVRPGDDYRLCHDSGDAGTQTQCPAEDAGLTLAGSDSGLFAKGIYAEVRRLPPETAPVPGALLTSMDKFTTASFAVRGEYARGEAGLGAADIEQGIIRVVPRARRTN
ncbi:putative Tfp pilus assembly protein [Salinisphaera sp. PC39]|uniref:pilus assembly PilX family protein n=1 Tax=Salinisphaera sp. PC39 TaxID=1304156 RepID=UPI00333F5FB5